MSSEQVIAEMRDFAKGATIMDVMDAPAIVAKWADRLSTPAAGGDDLLDRLDREAGAWESWNADYSDQPSECCVTSPPLLREASATIRQLQARNAEQAARIAELERVLVQAGIVADRLRESSVPAIGEKA